LSRSGEDRRVQRTRKSLHQALMSLVREGNYDSITVQQILDRANIGRSTFYSHFQNKDELLISGVHDLRTTLTAAQQKGQLSAKGHERVIGFSLAMFEHANEDRNIYRSLLRSQAWPLVRQRIQDVLAGLIREECRSEIGRHKKGTSEIPIELLVHVLAATLMSVLAWWIDYKSGLSPTEINDMFRALVLPSVRSVLS